jgi:hypothetical protein
VVAARHGRFFCPERRLPHAGLNAPHETAFLAGVASAAVAGRVIASFKSLSVASTRQKMEEDTVQEQRIRPLKRKTREESTAEEPGQIF